jgi:hypothetical protein
MQSLLNRMQIEFQAISSVIPLQIGYARTQKAVLSKIIELHLGRPRVQERVARRSQKRASFLSLLIDEIEELNITMTEIGLQGDVGEADSFRDRAVRVIDGDPPPQEQQPKRKRREAKQKNDSPEQPPAPPPAEEETAQFAPSEESEPIIVSESAESDGHEPLPDVILMILQNSIIGVSRSAILIRAGAARRTFAVFKR